ncbi:MAG: helix-turn-helix domain-containing protein [Desulfobacteraceae bacterium]|nr:helix-turn-helix domain-containing protein [Desulfobacteraceae bacterium]
MRHGLQKEIAEKAEISTGYLSELISVKKRPSWHTAKKLSQATNTDPVLWLEGKSEDIKEALSNIGPRREKRECLN